MVLAVLALPAFSPDAWWHLSAGRWIWAHGAVPDADMLSFTRFGEPWLDFEWGFQLLLYPFGQRGDVGLWAAKAVLLALAYLPIDGILKDRGADGRRRALGAALWAAAMLPKADIRPDLISAALFALQLRRLAKGRASFLSGFLLFAVWANLHAGFALGLLLYPAWAAASRLARREFPAGLRAEACGAALGALLNPYGLGLASVFAAHALDPVRADIAEWGGFSLRWPFHWPAAAVMAAGAWTAWRRRHDEPAAALALVLLAASLFSGRFTSYWPAAGIPLLASALAGPRSAPAALAALSILLALSTRVVSWGRAYQDLYVARRAADFIVSERAALGRLRLFNMYEWGGYLGWRGGPDWRVYGDGRYLFHGQLDALQDALDGPERMAKFLERESLDGLLIRNFPRSVRGTRVYPDGSRRELSRPWHVSFLPRKRWALVWWDAQALVFVDRAKAPAAWLAAHEFRWLRPGDEEALADAIERGEAPRAAVAAEKARRAAP